MNAQHIQVEEVGRAAAPPQVQKILQDIQETMGIPWPPQNWRAYARYPAVMLRFWDRLRPAVTTGPFLGDAIAIVDQAYRAVDDWYRPSYTNQLPEGEGQRIRWELDALEYGFPQLLIQQAALQLALHGETPGAMEPVPEAPRQPSPYRHPELQLVDEQDAGLETRAIYQDIRQTLEVPLVNSAFQTLAKWPALLFLAWEDIKTNRPRPQYHALEQELARMADEAASRLHPAVCLDPLEIRAALENPADENHLRDLVELFTRALPAVIIDVAILRLGAGSGAFAAAPSPRGAGRRGKKTNLEH